MIKKVVAIILAYFAIYMIFKALNPDIAERIEKNSKGRFTLGGYYCFPDYYINKREYIMLPHVPLGMYLIYQNSFDLGKNASYPTLVFLGPNKEIKEKKDLSVTHIQKVYITKDLIVAQNAKGWYQITDNWPKAIKIETIPTLPTISFQKLILFKPMLWEDSPPSTYTERYATLKENIYSDNVQSDSVMISCIEKIAEYTVIEKQENQEFIRHKVMGKSSFSYFIMDLEIGVPRWVDQEAFYQEIELARKEKPNLEWYTSSYAQATERQLKGLTRNDSQAFEVIDLEQAKSPSAP